MLDAASLPGDLMEIDHVPAEAERHKGRSFRNLAAFWLLGLFNNSSYVIMLAGANHISSGAVGFVFVMAIGPAALVKAAGPYVFHLLPYGLRASLAAALMSTAYTVVALSSSRGWQLAGVAAASLQPLGKQPFDGHHVIIVVFGAAQGGLGEATCLALTSRYATRPALTAWSSGTGFAGVFGYAWVALLNVLGGLGFTPTLLLANVTTLAWLATYFRGLGPPQGSSGGAASSEGGSPLAAGRRPGGAAHKQSPPPLRPLAVAQQQQQQPQGVRLAHAPGGAVPASGSQPGADEQQARGAGGEGAPLLPGRAAPPARSAHLAAGAGERLQRTFALWPFMGPLFLVYFAEYAMQSGTWTAIGFPVTSEQARGRFYVFANWCYQAGVFVSRSSGTLYQADRRVLWAMPFMQLGWLAFFLVVAVLRVFYSYAVLLPICFVTGLLGGAVYVNAFTLITHQVAPAWREFSLGAASLGDSLGVALADVVGVLIQGCLYRVNGLAGAHFACGAG